MAHIVFDQVHVHYPVVQDHYKSIRRAFLRGVTGGKLYGEDAAIRSVHALQGIEFTLNDGDRVGLIGRNGAGKSTLLKTLGGFILPDAGRIIMEGRVTTLFSVSGGMDLERSGYDNIFLVGRLLGISKKAMAEHIADIEEFTELGDFLRMPVRSYSDGMKVRLGFAIVTCVHPEILILDEAIGAGDAHFIEKATVRARKMYERASIMVMASHTPSVVEHLCNKAIWLEHGCIVRMGGVKEVMGAYMDSI